MERYPESIRHKKRSRVAAHIAEVGLAVSMLLTGVAQASPTPQKERNRLVFTSLKKSEQDLLDIVREEQRIREGDQRVRELIMDLLSEEIERSMHRRHRDGFIRTLRKNPEDVETLLRMLIDTEAESDQPCMDPEPGFKFLPSK